MDHPLVAQTVTDCLTEAMDIEGLVQVLERLRAGSLLRVAVDTPEPSPFAHAVLDSQPYTFLDDAPLEERRARAVTVRRGLDVRTVEALGSLDADAVARVREEAWPRPESREEVHEVLSWMGYVTDEEAAAWQPWVDSLRSAGRILARDGQYRAVEFPESVEALLLGRLEACGPVVLADEAIAASSPVPTVPAEWREAMGVLERSGRVLRTRLAGVTAWCDRRLLARIHRYTVEGLRARSRPVSLAAYLRFLSTWQHATEESRVEGPNGILEIIGQLAGFAIPAHAWEHDVFARRCRDYRPEWLDRVTLNGDVAWGRLFGSAGTAVRTTPLSLWPREDLEAWLGLADFVEDASVMSPVALAISTLLRERGALFAADLERRIAAPREAVDEALGELIARGCVTSDSFDGLRRLLAPQSQRSLTRRFAGRWALLRTDGERREPPSAAFLARQFLRRYGVVFRRVLLRERTAVPWRDLARELRLLELKGEVLGGRFVEGPSGEQFALPRAVPLLRDARAEGPLPEVPPHDPMHLRLFELEPLSASREPAVPS